MLASYSRQEVIYCYLQLFCEVVVRDAKPVEQKDPLRVPSFAIEASITLDLVGSGLAFVPSFFCYLSAYYIYTWILRVLSPVHRSQYHFRKPEGEGEPPV